jgi:hypothetical protein
MQAKTGQSIFPVHDGAAALFRHHALEKSTEPLKL